MDWIERDLRYNWHPYTQMKDCENLPPILIERAEGIKFYDSEGNAYYDTISSWWCNVHGHNHPKIIQAINDQLDSLEHVLFAGFTHKPAILLAEALVDIAPSRLRKVFFSDNGSTAVETALKISFQYWQNTGRPRRSKFISLENAYHGDTVGAMSLAGRNPFNKIFAPLFFDSFRVPSPNCPHCPMKKTKENCRLECSEPLEKLLRKKNKEIAGIILEPLLQAAGGMVIYPIEYLRKVAELATTYQVHLIVDEVATGFGRTGKMFAVEHAGVEPDLMCLSKGITGGYLPLGATLVTNEIYYAFYDDYTQNKTFFHGHTYTANPLACAAALASLDIFEEERALERISQLIPIFHKKMEGFRHLPLVEDVRYIGMIGALELKSLSGEERMELKVHREGLKEGLILRPLGNVVYLFLPLCTKEEELEEIVCRCHRVLDRLKIETEQNLLTRE